MWVRQLTYGMIPGDAISNDVLEIDARLRAWGLETAIYAQHIAPELAARAQPDESLIRQLGSPDEHLIYHYSIYSPNLRQFRAARGRRLLIYHNITPPQFFHGWDAQIEMQCDIGRRALSGLVGCDLALGVSDYNRRELIAAGFAAERTGILPIFLTQRSNVAAAEDLLGRLREPGVVNWLTVGRVVPHKAIEQVIRVFYVYQGCISPQAHLHAVGSRYVRAYAQALDDLVVSLGLAQHVTFSGCVSEAALAAYYQTADLYITASLHEGFCVPLIECMHYGVPALARKAGAIPETLGSSGVLFTGLGYEQVAEMAHLMVTDELLRAQIIRRQKERLQALGPERAEAALRCALERVGVRW